jgi:hypothetical protein
LFLLTYVYVFSLPSVTPHHLVHVSTTPDFLGLELLIDAMTSLSSLYASDGKKPELKSNMK